MPSCVDETVADQLPKRYRLSMHAPVCGLPALQTSSDRRILYVNRRPSIPVLPVKGNSEPEIVASVSSSPLTDVHSVSPLATFVTTMSNFRSALFLPSAPELSQQLWSTCSQRMTFVLPSVNSGSGRIVGGVELTHA